MEFHSEKAFRRRLRIKAALAGISGGKRGPSADSTFRLPSVVRIVLRRGSRVWAKLAGVAAVFPIQGWEARRAFVGTSRVLGKIDTEGKLCRPLVSAPEHRCRQLLPVLRHGQRRMVTGPDHGSPTPRPTPVAGWRTAHDHGLNCGPFPAPRWLPDKSKVQCLEPDTHSLWTSPLQTIFGCEKISTASESPIGLG